MFESYVNAKTRKMPKWVLALIVLSITVHAGAAGALIVKQFWTISRLPVPEAGVELTLGPPPPPPPPKGGGKKTESLKDKIKVRKVEEAAQPSTPNKLDMTQVEVVEPGDDEGVEGGVEGGVAGGQIGGVLGGQVGGTGAAPPPPPPPQPAAPKVVPQVVLEQQRISGEKDIRPPEPVKIMMVKQGERRITATVKMCLTEGGAVKSLNVQKSSGYSEYDDLIKSKMRAWKYRPFMVNGKATPVCTAVTFIYNQL
jgi:protein TonB